MKRIEGPEKVSGRAKYTCDIRLPGQLCARVLRSPLPHARIRSIDTARAAKLAGVQAVISSGNVDVDWYDKSKLFDPTVRFIGDEVAAVAGNRRRSPKTRCVSSKSITSLCRLPWDLKSR